MGVPRVPFAVVFFVIAVTALATRPARAQGVWTTDSSGNFDARCSFSADTINGKIYVTGGRPYGSINYLSSPQVFDPNTHTWSSPATTGYFGPGGVQGGHFTIVFDNKIFVVEIYSFSPFTDSVKVFDLATSNWSTITTSGTFTPREGACSAVVDGKLYVIGGDTGRLINNVDVFDPSTLSWSQPTVTGIFNATTDDATCSVVNGKIYVLGPMVIVFDPSTNAWSSPVVSGKASGGGLSPSSTVFNNKIYFMGGDFDAIGLGLFDPATNIWSTLPTMPTGRSELSTCTLNGKIYALGGYRPHQELNTIEVFTPEPLGVSVISSAPNSIALDCAPDPATSSSNVSFTLQTSCEVHLTLFDVGGHETQIMPAQWLDAGPHSVTWDASKYPSGMYLCRLVADGESVTRRVVVMH